METIINWLVNAEKHHISGRGDVYVGPAPFSFDKDNKADMDRLYDAPWVISHPDTRDRLFRVIGVESFCIRHISEGSNIGLMVEEINGPFSITGTARMPKSYQEKY